MPVGASGFIREMASFLLTATVGAVLNAAAFTGGSYLAHYLYTHYYKWKASMARAEQWKEEQEENKEQAACKFKSTHQVFKYYAGTHPVEHLTEPQFSNYYTPSKEQRSGEMLFTGMTVAGLAYGISRLV